MHQALKRKEHSAQPQTSPSSISPAAKAASSPYEQLLIKSPSDAVETAWKDVERAAYGALETKMNFPDRTNPTPAGAFATLLRNFAGVDQQHATAFCQLGSIREAIAAGGKVDQSIARTYCSDAVSLIAYLREK